MTHPLSSADIDKFLPEITKFCHIKREIPFRYIISNSCKDCLNKHSNNFDDVSKTGYPRPS